MKTKVLLIILFSILVMGKLQAQWTQTNGPEGGPVNCFTRVGNSIWMGSPYGIYISADEGISWQKSNVLNNLDIKDIYATADTIVVIYTTYLPIMLNYGGDIRSISSFDGGANWTQPINIIQNSYTDNRQLFRCQSALVYYNYYALYISMDMGLSWVTRHYPPTTYINNYFIDSIRISLSTCDSGTSSCHLLISNDLAQSWQDRGDVVDNYFYTSDSLIISSNYIDDTTCYRYALMRSTDIGITWDTIFTTPCGKNLTDFAKIEDSIYVNSSQGSPYLSIDQGLNWQLATYPPDFFSWSMDLNNGDKLHCEDMGLQRYSQSLGMSLPSNSGIKNQSVYSLTSTSNCLYSSTKNSLYRSPDQGLTWSQLFPPTNHFLKIYDFESRNDTVFWVNQNNLGRSFDNGLTWDTIQLPGFYHGWNPTTIELLGNRLFCSSDCFRYSDDWGLTWDTLPQLPHPGSQYFNTVGNIKIHNNILFAMGIWGNVYKYNEMTGQWDISLVLPVIGDKFNNLLFSSNGILFLNCEQKFAYSTNNGLTWITPTNLGLPYSYGFKLYPTNVHIYLGLWLGMVNYSGLWYSSNQGNNWYPFPMGNSGIQVTDFAVQNGIVFAGSKNSSVWQHTGPFYICSGKVYHDNNNNGIPEPGEPGLANVTLVTNPGGWMCSSDSLGNFTIISDVANDTLKPVIPQSIITVNPAYKVLNSVTMTQDFGIYPVPGIKNLSIDLTNINIFRIGFSTVLNLRVKNNGSVSQLPLVSLAIPANLEYQSANPAPGINSGDTLLTWLFNSLNFMDFQNIQVIVKTPLSAFLGDTIVCKASVTPVVMDATPADNYSSLTKTVLGSYDPNDKTCEQGDLFPVSYISYGKELVYTIRFQNTGNLSTEFVRILDTLSPYLDWASFRLVSSSNPVKIMMQSQGVVEFIFNPLSLPSSAQDELASMGFVKYAIKCKMNTQLGDVITNQAHIIFDYNQPILTNMTSTEISNISYAQISDPSNPFQSLIAYPNPANTELNLKIEGTNNDPLLVNIFDFTGRQLITVPMNNNITSINTAGFPSGFYSGSIITGKGSNIGTFKFIVTH